MKIETKPLQNLNQPLNLAKKYEEAGDKAKAARFYQLAGDNAAAHYANQEALTYYQMALERTVPANFDAQYQLRFAKEKIYALLSQPDARSENLSHLAALADQLDNDQLRADVAVRLVMFKLSDGQHEDVISIARLAVRIAEESGAVAAAASLTLIWGRALGRLSQVRAAQAKFTQALKLARENELKKLEADALRNLGAVNEDLGDYSGAKSLYKQALQNYQLLSDQRGMSNTLNNLGKVAFDQGEFTAALKYWDQAKPNYLVIGDKSGLCRILINQSAVCMDMGDYERAESYSREAFTLSQEIGLRFGQSLALINMSLVNHYNQNQTTAQEKGVEALKLALDMKSKRLEGYAHNSLGKIFHAQQQVKEAVEHYWNALSIWHELDLVALKLEAEAGLAAVALSTGELESAQWHVESILNSLSDDSNLDGTHSPLEIFWSCYQVLLAAGDSRANQVLEEAHHFLNDRAHKISDACGRTNYLEKVVVHSQIMSEYGQKVAVTTTN